MRHSRCSFEAFRGGFYSQKGFAPVPYIRVLIRADQLSGDSPAMVAQEASKETVRTLLQAVADGGLTVEEALDCFDFVPEEEEVVEPRDLQEPQALRFRFSCDRNGMGILLMLVRDRIHPVDRVLSCFIFTGEARTASRGT